MMSEGLYLLPGEEEQHERAREAWVKAERAALEAARQRSKNGGEIVHNLICECGCEHLIRLTVTVGNPAQHIERPDGRMMADLSPFMRTVVQDYFRAERPPLSECYRRSMQIALSHGWFVESAPYVGRTIKKMARDTEFRAYRTAGGGSYLSSVLAARAR